MQVCVWAAKSVHFHCQWSQIELNYLREDMLDDRSQSLHSLISLNEHPLQLSDGLLFLLRLLFTLILFCHGCSVCSGGLRCILWAVCGFVDGSGCRSCSSGARDTVDVFKICHWCHWCVTIQHIWHLKEIKVKALRSVSVFFFHQVLHLKAKKQKKRKRRKPTRSDELRWCFCFWPSGQDTDPWDIPLQCVCLAEPSRCLVLSTTRKC